MSTRKRAFAQFGAVAACMVLVAACTPEAPAASPTPIPTPVPMTPTPTETAQEREERLAYEGAEKAYRTFRNEYLRVTASTYEPRMTRIMKQNAGGPYLKAYEEFLRIRRDRGLKSASNGSLKYVRRLGYEKGEVLLRTCEDGRATYNVDRKGNKTGFGRVVESEVTVKLRDGRWKLWDADQKEPKSCGS